MRTLIALYKQGKILYPRVENTYITKSLYSYFPHPELKRINSFFEPLAKPSYSYNESSLLLHLHNLRYINISQIENTKKNIIKIKNDKEKYKHLLDLYKEDVYEKKEVKLDYFLNFQKDHYKNKKPYLKFLSKRNENMLDEVQKLHEELLEKKYDKKNQIFIAN